MRLVLLSVSALALAACSPAAAPTAAPEAPAAAEPVAEAAAEPEAAAPAPVEVKYPKAGTYKMDKGHSEISWTLNHLGLTNYTVGFETFSIDLDLDPADMSQTKVAVTIDPKSVDPIEPDDYMVTHPNTGFTSWKDDLGQSERLLNGNTYPTITFVSTKVNQTGPDTAEVTGDLTFLGVTKPVTLDVKYNGVVNFPNAPEMDRIGFSATTVIKRSDFGSTAMAGYVGDDVKITVETELNEVMAE
ncbi:MAG: YceI family protein [Hyphomonas sp.]|uniref:YceI family protein n=1 Tax=Hyphomonas sp. TaxID=87 RepID=UPI0035287671